MCSVFQTTATISQDEYDKKVVHGYAGKRGTDGMSPADANGDIWWTSYDSHYGTLLNYGFIARREIPLEERECVQQDRVCHDHCPHIYADES